MVNLAVAFDDGLTKSKTPTGIDYPSVTFNTATTTSADNQLCRTSADATTATGKGCVFALNLQPAPLGTDGKPMVNVDLEKLIPQSSVAVLNGGAEDPEVPAGKTESDEPAILVDATLVLDGPDPYKQKGVRITGERLKKKAGKAGAKAGGA